MIQDYIQQHYLQDLSVFHGDDIPLHGSFGGLCGMTISPFFDPIHRAKLTSPSDFLCCLYELNLINQGICSYYPSLHLEWLTSCHPFLDSRACTVGHRNWTDELFCFCPNQLFNHSRKQPDVISIDQLKSYTRYFFYDYLAGIFNRRELDPVKLLECLKDDPSCHEVREFC